MTENKNEKKHKAVHNKARMHLVLALFARLDSYDCVTNIITKNEIVNDMADSEISV